MQISLHRCFARTLWIKLHLYFGLVFGLLFAVIGLTGSLSVYRDEIDVLLNPELVIAEQSVPWLGLDQIITAVRAKHPDRHGVWTLEMPRTRQGAMIAWFDKPKESEGLIYAPLMVAVDPYTGKILSSRFWGQTFITWINDLHTRLLLEASAPPIMAGLAALLFCSVSSGLCLWWPGWRKLPGALRIQLHAGLMRFIFDSHRLLGALSGVILLILAFTGFHLAYPPLLETLTDASGMGHGDEGPTIHSSAVPNNHPVSLAEAVLVAKGLFPSSELRRISTPRGETGVYRINLRQSDEINQHHPSTTLWIDRWSGQIRAVLNPHQFSSGQRFTTWLWPLHTGEAIPGWRFVWFLTGLAPLVLFATGLTHWLFRQGLIKDRPMDWQGWRENALRWGASMSRRLVWIYNGLRGKLEDWLRKFR